MRNRDNLSSSTSNGGGILFPKGHERRLFLNQKKKKNKKAREKEREERMQAFGQRNARGFTYYYLFSLRLSFLSSIDNTLIVTIVESPMRRVTWNISMSRIS